MLRESCHFPELLPRIKENTQGLMAKTPSMSSEGGASRELASVSQNQCPRSQHWHPPGLGRPLPHLEPREGCGQQRPALPSSGSAAEVTWNVAEGERPTSPHAPLHRGLSVARTLSAQGGKLVEPTPGRPSRWPSDMHGEEHEGDESQGSLSGAGRASDDRGTSLTRAGSLQRLPSLLSSVQPA